MTDRTIHGRLPLSHIAVTLDAINMAARADHRDRGARHPETARLRRRHGRGVLALAGLCMTAGATLFAWLSA